MASWSQSSVDTSRHVRLCPRRARESRQQESPRPDLQLIPSHWKGNSSKLFPKMRVQGFLNSAVANVTQRAGMIERRHAAPKADVNFSHANAVLRARMGWIRRLEVLLKILHIAPTCIELSE
jgi:hypothetical protein